MEAAAGRRVRSGKEYDHLFPRPNGADTLIKKSADVSDTVSFIQRIVPLTLSDTAKVSKLFKGKNLRETCSNYWQFVFDHIPYHRDKDGVEQVRRPARTWWDRKHPNEEGNVGVDCDCYTVFLSSMLMNADIPHKYRITKYPKRPPETSHWQHIYIVVPRDGKLDHELSSRDDYIVMDCVKNDYDDEQPYLEAKDYNMRLDYLNGFEESAPKTVDEQAIAALDEDNDLGKLKLGQAIKKGLHTLNRFTNPGTILLRNGFLLIMKENLFGVAKKLRYAYVTDEQAAEMGMNLNALNKLRKVKDRAETIYYQAGGKKENLRKAILTGKGNKDKKVPLSGLLGLGEVYADQDEYRILNSVSGLGELGDPVSGSAIAAATTAITAIAGALKQVKGLFKPGTSGAKEMDAPTTLPSSTNSESNDITNTDTSSEPAVSNQSGGGNASLVPSTSSDNTSSEVTTNSDGTKENEKGGIMVWAKANPLLATGIVAGVAAGAYLLLRKKEAKGGLNGFSGRRKKRRSKPKTSKYKAVRIK